MLKKEDIFWNFEKIKNWVEKIVLIPKFVESLSDDKHSLDFFNYCISLYKWTAVRVDENTVFETSFAEWKKIIPENVVLAIDEKLEFEKLADLVDAINYVNIWILNTYKVQINDLKKIEIISIKTNEIDLKNEDKEKMPNDIAVYNSILHIKDFKPVNGSKKNTVDSILEKSLAFQRLKKEIDEDKIYIYLSKPERNIVIKYIIFALCCFGLLLSTIYLIMLVIQNSFGVGEVKTKRFIYSFLFLGFFGINASEVINSFKNENYKYSFDPRIFFYLFVFFAFLNFVNPNSDIDKTFTYKEIITKIYSFTVITTVATTIIYLYSCIFLNPKKNKKLINDRLQYFISEGKKQKT